ncbi:maltose acetyltransferase domain-containing protein [Modicisalibacter radicis]|nr:maltose acetyltransferase domain-containing protein [Halomonas sp. EAR18]
MTQGDELAKMLAGVLYNAEDSRLLAARLNAQGILATFVRA